MPQNTNLNVQPYYDDFDKKKNFYKILFRPGFPIQARELTTSQSILQNQVESVGTHLFKEGAMVIPGQVGYDSNIECILLQTSFLGAEVEAYRSQLRGKIITGLKTGVKAKILYSISAAESEKGFITLYVKYTQSGGSEANTRTYENNEQLFVDSDITFGTTLIETGSPFAQLLPSDALGVGSAAYISEGVYFMRGHFVDVATDYILLDQYGNNPTYRIGFQITESIITSEDDESLNDNAAGSSNYSAPGAHRFKISVKLVKKLIDDDSDKNFIELLRINASKVQNFVSRTAYSELEKSLAMRTFRTSGNYVVKNYGIVIRDQLNDDLKSGINGVYSAGSITRSGLTASDDYYICEISPGVAFVNGYQIETITPQFIDFPKPRDTKALSNQIVPFTVGNSVTVTNVYGFPNFTGSTVSSAYQVLELRDTVNGGANYATPAGNVVGFARSLSLEHISVGSGGTYGGGDDFFTLNSFDIQMLTTIRLNASTTIQQGSQIIGATSGTKCFIVSTQTSQHLQVYQVEGVFRIGEEILVDGFSKGVVSHVHTYEFSDARSVVARDEVSISNIEFTANIVLDDFLSIDGDTFTYSSSAGTITGFNTNFAKDLRPGDNLYVSATNYLTVTKVNPTALQTTGIDNIFNYTTQVVSVVVGGGSVSSGTFTNVVRSRVALRGQDNNDLFSPLPKKYVNSISDESMSVRRTYDSLSVPSGTVTIDLGGNEQFSSISNTSYHVSVLASTNSTYPVGSHIQLVTDSSASSSIGYATFTSNDRTTLNISNLTNITSIKVTATISKNVVTKKLKTLQKMFVTKVVKTIDDKDTQLYGLTYSNLYGTRIEDKEISLGLSDAFQLQAIYESLDAGDPTVPTLTLSEATFFAAGTFITGKTSSAKGKVISFSTQDVKVSYIQVSGIFLPGEQITGFDSNGIQLTALINDDTDAISFGSKVVTQDYYLELSQTGFFYNTSRIIRKTQVKPAIRKLLIISEWFAHAGTGDYFAGQSYSGLSYYDIPFFDQSQVLTDVLDFRPSVRNLYSGTGTIASPASVQCSTLDFKSRVFTSGSTVIDIPKIDSDFRCDFDFYLPKVAKLFLSAEGKFEIVSGKSAEVPEPPEDLTNAMFLATIRMRPYGFDPEKDVVVTKEDNRRYTMRDIGSIDRRLSNVEYYTSLSLLESETANTKITDSSGKDRLKNGFIVDDFASHDKSDTSNADYRASLDYKEGHCRPAHYTTNVSLQWNEAATANVVKVGPLLMLPYSEEIIIQQPYASRQVNVNPFNVFTYIGRIDLTPASDDWIDTKREPAKITQIEGNFESTRKEMNLDQNGLGPIQWNSWQTQWTGDVGTISSSTVYQPDWVASDEGKSPAPWVWGGKGLRRINQVDTIKTTVKSSRSGTRSRLVPRIDNQSQGDSLLSSTVIPWIRSRNVQLYCARLKPRTRFYAFFDNVDFTNYMVPKLIEVVKDTAIDSRSNATPFAIGEKVIGQTSGCRLIVAAPNDGFTNNPYDDTLLPSSYSSTTSVLNIDTEKMAAQVSGTAYGNIAVGEVLIGEFGAKAVVKARRLISDRSGSVKSVMWIPDPNIDTNPRWGTGSRSIRLTTSPTDSRIFGAVTSSAETRYTASGILNIIQENILAVRNSDVVMDTVNEDSIEFSTRTETRQIGWYDPLAQSFIIDKPGGCFITSFDVFFASKDDAIPISCQIRAMENGYPSKRILPFSDVTILPTQVQLSETAVIPTKFTFQAPVYLLSSVEYCFVLLSDSNEYNVWVSRMGEDDITNNRTISEQPYAGVLFKSQNASTWTADQYEDLKFTSYLAKFNIGLQSKVIFNNTSLALGNKGILHLANDSITTFKPDLNLIMSLPNVKFTQGATLRYITGGNLLVGSGTVRSFTEAATGTIVTIRDVVGQFPAASRIASSKTVGTFVVTGASGNFTVGNVIKNGAGTVAEITGWTSGSNTLVVNYVSPTSTGVVFQANDSITSYESIVSTTPVITATISTVAYTGDLSNANAIQTTTVTLKAAYALQQQYIQIRHSNHCMYDTRNNVTITGAQSEVIPTYLTNSVSATETSLVVEDALEFHKIINGSAITLTNPGYLRIVGDGAVAVTGFPDGQGPIADISEFVDQEIIAYTAISTDGKSITVVRAAGAKAFPEGSRVECYNLDGIPLTSINKIHNSISSPTLDTYKIFTGNVATNGVVSGGSTCTATQNVQFDVLTPQIAKVTFPETRINARAQFITGTSIGNGAEPVDQLSFVNDGQFDNIGLDTATTYDSPRMVASQLNENEELSGSKSMIMELTLDSTKPYLSPYIDLDRTSIITTMNRINIPDDSVATRATDDLHDAAYITKIATLSNNSGAIKIEFSAYRPEDTELIALYRVRPVGSTSPIQSVDYTPFPVNLQTVPGTTRLEEYFDYAYEVQGLKFDQYQIKIVMRSPIQSRVPIIQDFRAIALAI